MNSIACGLTHIALSAADNLRLITGLMPLYSCHYFDIPFHSPNRYPTESLSEAVLPYCPAEICLKIILLQKLFFTGNAVTRVAK